MRPALRPQSGVCIRPDGFTNRAAVAKLRRMSERGENALVAWLTGRFPPDPARVLVGIGDDLAVVRYGQALVGITADMLLDGVHFDTARHDPALIGRKALACSLSDCAAMGCEPVAATVSLALPETFSLDGVQRLYEGLAGLADEFGCRLVGGDTTSWPGQLAIDVAMLAEPMSPRGPIRRSEARATDALFVSGPLGGSILGKHLTFTPRLALARQLANRPELHAMMDLSDGLSMDLHRMCAASGCDAELDAALLESAISAEARGLAAAHAVDGGAAEPAARDHALHDGEDFELLIAGEASLADAGLGLIRVGRMVPRDRGGRTRITLRTGAAREPVEPRGYEHFR